MRRRRSVGCASVHRSGSCRGTDAATRAHFGRVAPQAHKGQFAGVPPDVPAGEDCLNINVVAPASADDDGEPARDGVHPRRRLQHRLLTRLQRPGTQFRGDRQGRLRQLRLPARRTRVSGLLAVLDASAADRFESGPARPDRGAALGAAQHPRVRRRPGPGDGLRRVGRGELGHDAHGDAVRSRTVRARDRPERAARRGLLAGDGSRLGRAVRRDPAPADARPRRDGAAHRPPDGRPAHRRCGRRAGGGRARAADPDARRDAGHVLSGAGRGRTPAAAASDGRLPRRLRPPGAAHHRHERPGGIDLPRAPRHPAAVGDADRGRPRARCGR